MDLYSQNFGLKCLILLEMGLFSTIKVHQNFHTMLLLLGLEWFLLEFVFRKRELNFMYFAFICKLNWDGGVINIFICLIYFFVFYNFRPALSTIILGHASIHTNGYELIILFPRQGESNCEVFSFLP